jgi:hypothetical protein
VTALMMRMWRSWARIKTRIRAWVRPVPMWWRVDAVGADAVAGAGGAVAGGSFGAGGVGGGRGGAVGQGPVRPDTVSLAEAKAFNISGGCT